MKRLLIGALTAVVLLGSNLASADVDGAVIIGTRDLIQTPHRGVRTPIHPQYLPPEVIVVLPKHGRHYAPPHHARRAGAPWEVYRHYSPGWNKHGALRPPRGHFRHRPHHRAHR